MIGKSAAMSNAYRPNYGTHKVRVRMITVVGVKSRHAIKIGSKHRHSIRELSRIPTDIADGYKRDSICRADNQVMTIGGRRGSPRQAYLHIEDVAYLKYWSSNVRGSERDVGRT